MGSLGLSGPFECRSGGESRETADADYLETIEILQEEIARLEQELELRDTCSPNPPLDQAPSCHDEAEAPIARETSSVEPQEVQRLTAELAGRDETILLLLDELSRVEAAQEASRAEWEQLNGWVAELEHRVEGQDGDALRRLENDLADQQQRADALQIKSDQDRRDWGDKRQSYHAEIARLQAAIDQLAASGEAAARTESRDQQAEGADAGLIETLQAENVRLRAAWQELVDRTSAEHSAALDERLAESLKERHLLRRKLEQVEDERKRERLEHQAALAEHQSQLSQPSEVPSPPTPPHVEVTGGGHERDLDLRVRALRQHLQEIEERERREREERRQKNLVVRLSRLWSRTSPR
jgi:hypothetical protein